MPQSQVVRCKDCGWNFDDVNFLQLHRLLMHNRRGRQSQVTNAEGIAQLRIIFVTNCLSKFTYMSQISPSRKGGVRKQREIPGKCSVLNNGVDTHITSIDAFCYRSGSPTSTACSPLPSFSCADCGGLSFSDCGLYSAHRASAHGDAAFVCAYCAKTFKLRGSLLVHERVVHHGHGHAGEGKQQKPVLWR